MQNKQILRFWQIAPQNIRFMFIDFVKVFRLEGTILGLKIRGEREILVGMLNQNFIFQIKSELGACGETLEPDEKFARDLISSEFFLIKIVCAAVVWLL